MRILFLTLALAACGTPAGSHPTPPADAAFPHPADFKEHHGAPALAADAPCSQCHAVDDGPTLPGPSCHSCHSFPHPADFRSGEVHGPRWKEIGQTDCLTCHGANGDQAPADIASATCVNCHSTFPHPAGWELLAGHGAAVVARGGTAACEGCHGGPEGINGATQCTKCHTAWPHPDGWELPTGHGAAYVASPTTCTTGCHTVRTPPSPPACAQCHDVYPHAADWTSAHIATVQQRGKASCTGCHPAGELAGPPLPNPTCGLGCHVAAP